MTKSNNGQQSLFPELSDADQQAKKNKPLRGSLHLRDKGLEDYMKSQPEGTTFKVSMTFKKSLLCRGPK